MLGLGLLVRLGREVLSGPVADSGLLPKGVYRHLVLAAMEGEDFPQALRHLKWVDDPLMAQILIFRLRLLHAGHRRRRQATEGLLKPDTPPAAQERYQALLAQEDRALELLSAYERQALAQLAAAGHPATPVAS